MTVAMGSSSLFIFGGFNHGIMNQYRENTVHSRYGHGQVNLKGYRNQVFEKPWEHWMSNASQISKTLRSLPEVAYVFPRVEFFSLITNGKITISGKGQGVDGPEESKFFNTLNIEAGSTLGSEPDGILLGKGLARALDVKPGDRVTVLSNTIRGSMNGADLIVTGIFHTGSKDFDDVVFRIPLSQASILLDTQAIESIAIGLKSDNDWGKVATAIQARYSELDATPFSVLDEVYYQHSVDWLGSQFAIIQLIILAIVILGIANTVSTGVMERKQEIGNLRANGDSVKEVLGLLSIEGLILGVLGSLVGIVLAYFFNFIFLRNGILMPPAPGLTRQFHVMIEFQPSMALSAFVLSGITAVLGTFLAALRVARLPIGESLRST